ncbi:MAG: AAA family ATPase [Planctomycetota bacterium]|jgi:predicted ATPase|nr:AAA family ATPase [Planctomycetota bacterium]
MMTLKKFRVTGFRSINDSGWIDCDDVTTLVGMNEAGKSNVIIALWKLHPARESDEGKIEPLHDMPNKYYAEWRNEPEKHTFISVRFELDNDIKDKLSAMCEYDISEVHYTEITRNFNGGYTVSFLTTAEGHSAKFSDNADARQLAVNEMPSFVYYSNYGNLDAQIYLPHTVKLLKGEKLPGFDNPAKVRTLRVLFEFVNLKAEEILELGKDPAATTQVIKNGMPQQTKTLSQDDITQITKKKEERTTLLNSASFKLTEQFASWWKQGDYTFRLQADGDFFKIWVSDSVRKEEIELERRSTGLQWFLSFFLVFLVESQSAHKGTILLLDEAGLTLHPMAQKDLVAFFENLSHNNQIIHTTHSPFLVDTSNIDRVKAVFVDKEGYTVVSDNLREADDNLNEKSVYAVHAALGLSVSDILLNGCQPIIVEGTSDQFYLNAIKLHLIKEGKLKPSNELIFMPSGGCKSKGVSAITSLVSGRNEELPFIILDSDNTGNSAKKELEGKLYSDCKEKLLSVATFVGFDGSEVEDLIPVELLSVQLNKWFGSSDDDFVPDETKPVVPQIEAFARDNSFELPTGWKVVLAKNVKAQLMKGKIEIPDAVVSKWVLLFGNFIAKPKITRKRN